MILGFFFSRSMSLELWDAHGLLDREKLIYEKHLNSNHFKEIYFFTYGTDDLRYASKLHHKIHIVPMPKMFNSMIGKNIYSFLLPIIQKKYLKRCDIYKNDQMDGSWSSVISKILYKKVLLIRTGFTLSLFMKQKGVKWKILISKVMEKFAYKHCNHATVSSKVSKEYILKHYMLKDEDVSVLYNYIDTDKFLPLQIEKKTNRLLFIGRFDAQKNIHNLLYAMKGIDFGLDLYGSGSMKEELIQLADRLELDVNFFDKVRNNAMPTVLNSYKYYILPSLYEGMPKTLLEAMSCGLICIGSDTLGINEVIEDKKNAYLISGFTSDAIQKVIVNVCNIAEDNDEIVKEARNTILTKFSLETYAKKEYEIFHSMDAACH